MQTTVRPLQRLVRRVGAGILGAVLGTCGACADDESPTDPYDAGDTGVDGRDAAREDAALDAGTDAATPTSGYWTGLGRELMPTASGAFVALACHNCYEDDLGDSEANLAATLDRLRIARDAGFDLLELDIKEEGGVWFVDHDDGGSTTGALLDAVLMDSLLQDDGWPLFVEIKETDPSAQTLGALVDLLIAAGFGVPGREVILRSFENRTANLDLASQVLVAPSFSTHAPYFRLHVIFHRSVAEALPPSEPFVDLGPHIQGVEFNREGSNVGALLSAAREQGLGSAVFNFQPSANTAVCSDYAELTDILTFDGEIGSCLAGIAGP